MKNEIVKAEDKDKIRDIFLEEGFSLVGFAASHKIDSAKIEEWLQNGFHAEMDWFTRNRELRYDPAELFPGTKTVITTAFYYFNGNTSGKGISLYAQGDDYHKLLKKKLKKCVLRIKSELFPEFKARITVDSAPVMEKYWAVQSGIGWLGKNGNVISRDIGSYFFLGEILTDLHIEPDAPVRENCGKCTKCLEACPTEAITEPYVVNAGRCLSYLTIEDKSSFLPEFVGRKQRGWIFGCDICQEVCPWNRLSALTGEKKFYPRKYNLRIHPGYWLFTGEDEFDIRFRNSAVRRAGYRYFMRNVIYLLENTEPDILNSFDEITGSFEDFLKKNETGYKDLVNFFGNFIIWGEENSYCASKIWENWKEYILYLKSRISSYSPLDLKKSILPLKKLLKEYGFFYKDILEWGSAILRRPHQELEKYFEFITQENYNEFLWLMILYLVKGEYDPFSGMSAIFSIFEEAGKKNKTAEDILSGFSNGKNFASSFSPGFILRLRNSPINEL